MNIETPELYTTLAGEGSDEFEEKRSIFIGHAKHVTSEDEAMEFIKSKKKEYSDATHNCWAYLLKGGIVARYSDDGEPQGTAGMPVLDIIRKNGCTDVVIVVTRYFGGTLLGTGGLVRAYTATAVGALEEAEIIRYDIYTSLEISVSYSDFGKISTALADVGFRTESTDYDTGVKIYGRVIKSKLDELNLSLVEATAGRVNVEIIGEEFGF